jgi:hypothetical protein
MTTQYFNLRRKFLVGLVLFLILLAASTTMGENWLIFTFFASVMLVLTITDFMFLDDTYFIFEPDIKNYARRTTPQF